MPQPSKCLFESTKLEKKKRPTKDPVGKPAKAMFVMVVFFLQLSPKSVPEKTEWYHPRIRIKTIRENIGSANISQKNSCVQQRLPAVDQHMKLMYMSCFHM